MKKEPFICAVLCGSMLISLAGCGNQPVPIQPETAGTSSTVIAEKSSESSQNSSVPADRMEQTEPAASGNGLAVPSLPAEQEKSNAGSSAPASTQAPPESRNRPSRRKSRGLRQLQHSRIHQLRRKPPDQQNRSRMSLQFLPKQRDQIQRSRQNPRSPNRPIRYIPRRTMTALYGKQPPMPKAMRRKASPLSGKTPWSSAGMLDIWEHRELNTKV